jgi:hypothetical protein
LHIAAETLPVAKHYGSCASSAASKRLHNRLRKNEPSSIGSEKHDDQDRAANIARDNIYTKNTGLVIRNV